jgi:hypothetical protein
MTLRTRLARLETRKAGAAWTGPRVIITEAAFADDGTARIGSAAFAQVLTATGWQTIIPHDDEGPEMKAPTNSPCAHRRWQGTVRRARRGRSRHFVANITGPDTATIRRNSGASGTVTGINWGKRFSLHVFSMA